MLDKLPPLRLDLQHPIQRRAVRTAIAILLAVAAVHLLHLPHGEWVVVSAFIVSRDTIGDTIWKAKGRFWGTVFGAIAALLFYALVWQHHNLIIITAFLTLLPYLYFRPSTENYGYAKFFQQFAFICFLSTISEQPSAELMKWRAVDIAIGCIVGIVTAIFVLPNSAQSRWRQGQVNAWNDLKTWFKAIASNDSTASIGQQRQQLSSKAQSSVFQLSEYLASRQQELLIQPKERHRWKEVVQCHNELIQAYRRIYQSMLYLDIVAQQGSLTHASVTCSTAVREIVQQLTTAFEQMSATIGTRSPLHIPTFSSAHSIVDTQANLINNLAVDELNIFLQLTSVLEAIVHFNEIRNQFLSLVVDSSHVS